MITLADPDRMTLDDASRSSESVLIRRAQDGSNEAFEQLVLGLERRVFSTAWKMLGNSEDARDAAQEVFLRLFRSLSRVDPDRALGAWTHRITVKEHLEEGHALTVAFLNLISDATNTADASNTTVSVGMIGN